MRACVGESPEKYRLAEPMLAASLCRESFYFFVQEFWPVIIHETPVWNWHIKYLCDELQETAERVFRDEPKAYDMVINIPPGTTKSTICSIMFLPWIWTRMPSARMIGASYGENLQLDLSRACRDVIRSEKYRTYFPNIILSDDQDAKGYFMNTLGGRRKGIGVGGIAGFHAHFIVVDDPLDPRQAISEAGIKAANWWMDNVLSFRKINNDITPTILIMQRLCRGDPTDNMIAHSAKDKIKHICLPAVVTDKVNPPVLRLYYKDGLLDPVRLKRSVLADKKLMGDFSYSAQLLQNPVPFGSGMFDTEKINIVSSPPGQWVKVVRYWDNAGTKDAGCYTAGVKIGLDTNGRYWILHVKRGQWRASEREEIKKQTAYDDGRTVMIVNEQEPGSSGKDTAQATIKNLAGFTVRADRPTGDKAARAEPFSSQVNGGNVYMVAGLWNSAYLDEMQYFPASTNKDQIDASSGAFMAIGASEKPALLHGIGLMVLMGMI